MRMIRDWQNCWMLNLRRRRLMRMILWMIVVVSINWMMRRLRIVLRCIWLRIVLDWIVHLMRLMIIRPVFMVLKLGVHIRDIMMQEIVQSMFVTRLKRWFIHLLPQLVNGCLLISRLMRFRIRNTCWKSWMIWWVSIMKMFRQGMLIIVSVRRKWERMLIIIIQCLQRKG